MKQTSVKGLPFVYLPVSDIGRALQLYRDTLGLEEAWREGEGTVALSIPGVEVQLMLDQHEAGPGPFFQVEDVDAFYAEHKDSLAFLSEPQDIPGGRQTTFTDPFGNQVHLLHLSEEEG